MRLCRLWDVLAAQCQAHEGQIRLIRQCSCRWGSYWFLPLSGRDRLRGGRCGLH
jgi:hypothetical protein